MSKEEARIVWDFSYTYSEFEEKEGDEWLKVCVPYYIGTYEAIDMDVEYRLMDGVNYDLENYNVDLSAYDEIDINYDVDLGSFNVRYVDYIADVLGIKELHLLHMSSPKEYNFYTDKLIAQITKDDMWKLYEYVKDDAYYKQVVTDVTTSCDGSIAYYKEKDFYFSSKEDWSDDYNHPAILGVIMGAAVHKKMELKEYESPESILYLESLDRFPISDYISISSIKTYKDAQETEIEL